MEIVYFVWHRFFMQLSTSATKW